MATRSEVAVDLASNECSTSDHGYISRLLERAPGALETSLGNLAASQPLEFVRRHSGVEIVHQALAGVLSSAGKRLDELDDLGSEMS